MLLILKILVAKNPLLFGKEDWHKCISGINSSPLNTIILLFFLVNQAIDSPINEIFEIRILIPKELGNH